MSGRDTPTPARFLPGVIVADRWRVVARLGEGGMGEVYRADDLRLGEPVALKFLPERLEHDAGLRERFLGEAKLARKVAHPNVCRVFDLGEAGGRPFLSMEYVDGEDLGTLLTRIGRLPPDKAVQIAREVCAGLAAAHAAGILHRDLKPSNVMIDGRGHARLTDFGLATWAEGVGTEDALAGTPAYMAPEQLAGQAPSRASDIYALGLVLYEMFTGHRAFAASTWADQQRQKQTTTPSNPSQLAPGIDPAVERVIQRCLSPEPSQRPQSVAAVAASLPGGDPLAAALAAGETPSPELVAAGVGDDVIPARVAAAWLGLLAVALVALVTWVPTRQLLTRAPLQKPPAVLLDRARTICDTLGWTERRDDYSRLIYNSQVAGEIARARRLRDVTQATPRDFQIVFGLGYWSSPTILRPLAPTNWTPIFGDPALRTGMVQLTLDGTGNLTRFEAVPPPVDTSRAGPRPLDLRSVVRLIGAPDTLAAVRAEPVLSLPYSSDRRDAWRFLPPGLAVDSVHLEISSFRGRVVNLAPIPVKFLGISTLATYAAPRPSGPVEAGLRWVTVLLLLLAGFAAFVNLRRGRADLRGALRLALGVTLVQLVSNVLVMHRQDGLSTIPSAFLHALSSFGFPFLIAATLYLAFEPVLRQTWPHLMVSWMRLLDGRWRDSRVGADVLVGVAIGAALFVIGYGLQWAWGAATHAMVMPGALDDPAAATDTLMGGGWPWSQLLSSLTHGVFSALVFAGVLALFTSLTRQRWLGIALASTLLGLFQQSGGPPAPFDFAMLVLLAVVWTLTVMRTGLVTGVAMVAVWRVLQVFPMVTPGGSWYWPVTAVGLGAIALLAGGAFWLARGPRVVLAFGDESLYAKAPPLRTRPVDATSTPTQVEPTPTSLPTAVPQRPTTPGDDT